MLNVLIASVFQLTSIGLLKKFVLKLWFSLPSSHKKTELKTLSEMLMVLLA